MVLHFFNSAVIANAKMDYYICPIFRFATQTFNGGYKRKVNTDT